MTTMLRDLETDVEKAGTIEEGFAAYVRGMVDRMRAAFRAGNVHQANAIADEALNSQAAFSAALVANTAHATAPTAVPVAAEQRAGERPMAEQRPGDEGRVEAEMAREHQGAMAEQQHEAERAAITE